MLQIQLRGQVGCIYCMSLQDFCSSCFRCQNVVLDNVSLEKNIARNTALKENVFMMVVCIELRIPLFLVGKPGSSKSLAKTIVTDAMQGNSAKYPLFKILKQVDFLYIFLSIMQLLQNIIRRKAHVIKGFWGIYLLYTAKTRWFELFCISKCFVRSSFYPSYFNLKITRWTELKHPNFSVFRIENLGPKLFSTHKVIFESKCNLASSWLAQTTLLHFKIVTSAVTPN